MRSKVLLITIVIMSICGNNLFGQNRINSRLFRLKPPLYNSKSKVEHIDLSIFNIAVNKPIDNRSKFYGEIVYKDKKVQQLDEFYQSPTMIEIQKKMDSDLRVFGMNNALDSTKRKVEINTIVEVFYPDVRGFIWMKSFAKVRVSITAKSKDIELINKTYESFYITDGRDKEFEGSMMMTIEQGANVTIGIALRKALDEFYADLKEKLKKNH
jgi:hypothetical protein